MKARRSPRPPSLRAVVPPAATAPVRSAELPWFPFMSDGVHVKLCRVSLATGEMVLMVRAAPGAGLATHYHHGVFIAYTVSGQWRDLDHGWIAGPGDVVVEPAGSTHAFEVVGSGPAEAFVHLAGALEFRDEAGKTLCIENAETLHGRYLAHCALHGIRPVDVTGGLPG
jgi:2,4'-dihydroxyacetophenone dioxygenase